MPQRRDDDHVRCCRDMCKCVRAVAVCPQADMPSLYKSVDCFVLPSRGEGWGRPQVEAMAMGLPLIGEMA